MYETGGAATVQEGSECVDDVNRWMKARDQLSQDRTSRRGEAPVSTQGKRGQVKRKWVRREASL